MEVGGPLILIIIKFDMFEISRTALSSELILFIRLKFLSHSAVLTNNVFIQFMSGLRFLGSLLGSSSRSHKSKYNWPILVLKKNIIKYSSVHQSISHAHLLSFARGRYSKSRVQDSKSCTS